MGGLAAIFASTPEKVLNAAGVKVTDVGAASGGLPPMIEPLIQNTGLPKALGDETPWYITNGLKLRALRLVRPHWFEKRRRLNARHVQTLDVDLASFRSVSPAAKIAIQRERQYQRYLDDEIENMDLIKMDEAFKP